MLCYNAIDRISVCDALRHPYMNDCLSRDLSMQLKLDNPIDQRLSTPILSSIDNKVDGSVDEWKGACESRIVCMNEYLMMF